MSDSLDNPRPVSASPGTTAPGPAVLWTLRVLSLAAAGVSGYLLQVSLSQSGLPAGCGAGSGCSEVLTSPWSVVFGVPVSGPALLIYLMFFLMTFFLGPSVAPAFRRLAWSSLLVVATMFVAVAAWFIMLQVVVLKAICPWCMAEHLLGLLLAGMVFWQLSATSPTLVVRSRAPLLATGVSWVLCLVLLQLFSDYQPPKAIRLPPGQNADTGPGAERMISVLNGQLQIAPHASPHLGSADAPKLLVVLLDYCCPHCRKAHGYLLHGLNRYPDQFGVVLLPMPLNSKCNPHWEHTEPRFEHACELAHLALAVWEAKPEAFAEFDAWLFEPEAPRDPAEARQKAESLVDAAALDRALSKPGIKEQIDRNTLAYSQSGVDRIPIIMSPGFASLVGRPGSEEELFDVLEKELSLKPAKE